MPDDAKKSKENTILDRTGDAMLLFLVFSILGYLYEVAIMYFELHQGFVNRGFLYGPWLPIYGFGGTLILLAFSGLKKKRLAIGKISFTPILCFLGICLFTTGLELAGSYLVERFCGYVLWDYRYVNYGPTFEGRIALRSSLQFGILGLIALYVIQPLLKRGAAFLRNKFRFFFLIFELLLILVFLADLIYHLINGSNAKW